MSYSKLNLENKIGFALKVITVAQNDVDLSELFAGYGYTPEQFAIGREYHDAVQQLLIEQKTLYADRLVATRRVRAASKVVYANLKEIRQLVLLGQGTEFDAYEKLGLNRRLTQKRDPMIQLARLLYETVLTDETVMAKLEQYSVTREKLESYQANIVTLLDAIAVQHHQRGIAKRATARRVAATRKLDSWMRQFIGIARQLLKNDQNSLERMGLFEG